MGVGVLGRPRPCIHDYIAVCAPEVRELCTKHLFAHHVLHTGWWLPSAKNGQNGGYDVHVTHRVATIHGVLQIHRLTSKVGHLVQEETPHQTAMKQAARIEFTPRWQTRYKVRHGPTGAAALVASLKQYVKGVLRIKKNHTV